MRIFFCAVALLASGIFSVTSRAECFDRAGEWYHIDPDYLRAIAWQESRYNPGAKKSNRDRNGKITSTDYGIMQINSTTINGFQREYPGLTAQKLLDNPCLNIFWGAMVLRRNMNQYGTSWLAVGMYNAGVKNRKETIANRHKYAMLIGSHYKCIKTGSIPRTEIGD